MLRAFFDWIRSFFFSKQLDIACIGLQNAGKSSLIAVLTDNHFTEEMIPTVYAPFGSLSSLDGVLTSIHACDSGFNLRKIQKGNVVRPSLPPCSRTPWEMQRVLTSLSNRCLADHQSLG